MLDDLIYRLETRARIRRQIATRKSVQNGEPDRISDLLEEAAYELKRIQDADSVAGYGDNDTQQGSGV